MGRRTIKYIALALVAVLPFAANAGPTNVTDAADPYIHRQTDLQFPAQVGEFIRHSVDRYSDDGADTGAGYQLIRGGQKLAYVSMFVYPTPSLPRSSDIQPARASACAGVFEEMKTGITQRELTARLITEDQVAAPSPVYRDQGHRAVYDDGLATFDGKPEQRMHEEARLYCYAGGQWLVSYRISWPQGPNYDADVARLLAALAWTPKLAL